MSKGAFAKEEVMQEYLSALLTDDTPVVQAKVQESAVQHLFDKISVPQAEPTPQVPAEEPIVVREIKETPAPVEKETPPPVSTTSTSRIPSEPFQALFFKMAGLTLAVPLTELGGIHNLHKVTPLFGKPVWFRGVMTHREEKLSVVDTAAWIMPEKYTEKLAESLNYQYLIMLGDSPWGLACESLESTFTLQPDQVKWREREGKRPWLAGMVKDKMCALVDAQQLIALLNQGMDSSED